MIIDGLECGNFDRAVFEELREAKVAAVTVTCGFYEGAIETLDLVGKWLEFVRANSDIAIVASAVDDIEKAYNSNQVAVILGSQNSSFLDNRIAFVEIFARLGVRVMQLTYNVQNAIGCGCYESNDSGLTPFGVEVLEEMNRVGMLVDLSHVGEKTSLDALKLSKRPVAITHANAYALFPHKRNKSNEVLHALRDNGGVIGCPTYRYLIGDRACETKKAWGEMVAGVVQIVGIDHVGIGTDLTHNCSTADYLWMGKGRHTRKAGYSVSTGPVYVPPDPPAFFPGTRNMYNLVEALRTVGFSSDEVNKITYRNWLRLYSDVFS